MYTVEFGLFPMTGIAVGGVLYAACRWLLRLKTPSRWTQAFIATALLLTTLASTTVPVREIPAEKATAASTPIAPAAEQPTMDLTAYDNSETPATNSLAPGEPTPAPRKQSILNEQPTAFLQSVTLYWIGLSCVLGYFLCQLVWLFSLQRRYAGSRQQGTNIYLTHDQQPFSFGRSIFLPYNLDEEMRNYIVMHENAHIRHRHFLKLCLTQLVVVFNWYNPFVWLFFSEMHLQQELEVDGDVLSQGVDREAYQLSLLKVCTQSGKWILLRSAFGIKPLKQRIIFMNQTIQPTSMRRHQLLATATLLLVVLTTMSISCQTREKQPEQPVREHPMKGCWTIDWISNTGSGEEVHPVAMHYGFYNDTTFLCFSYWKKKGMNLNFCMSGEGYEWHGDTLTDANGHPTDYTFPDNRTAISRWLKDSTQMAGVSGPDITEQWSRIKPNEDIVAVFRAVSAVKDDPARPRLGAWLSEKEKNTYLLLTDSVFMVLRMCPTTVVPGFRYGASGSCGIISEQPDGSFLMGADSSPFTIDMPTADRLVLTGDKFTESYRRIDMPPYLLRAFAPALLDTESD